MNCKIFPKLLAICALLWAVGLVGCIETVEPGGGLPPAGAKNNAAVDVLVAGDRLKITFSGLPADNPIVPQGAPYEVQINDQGEISLPLINTIKAAGKSTGQLQTEIHDAYVPRFFRNMNVAVIADRYFYVGDEVKLPNRYVWTAGMTVLQAIQAGGGFTDFADRKHVQLKHLNGKMEVVNCKKAVKDPSLDLPVYPGDTIIVPRGI